MKTPMKRTGFKITRRIPLNRTPFKQKAYNPMRRTRLRVVGHSTTAELKQEIQRLVREIVMIRDKGCVLRFRRHCGGEIGQTVIQADHLITRANTATYADTRLIVCICRGCHGWKKWHEAEYNDLIRIVISPERVALWDKCEEDRKRYIVHKADWKMEIIVLKKELASIT